MSTVAIVLNESRAQAVELARQAATWLVANGHAVRIPENEAAVVGLVEHACPPELVGPRADLAVSLGGDGTILRTVGMVAHHQVPVMGVNIGRLGYLAHVEPDALCRALERFLAGDYAIAERLLLCVRISPGPDAGDHAALGDGAALLALNEAVVEKTSAGQVVHVGVTIDGRYFTSYAADGMIVATPTGSTAYAFSARGPIVSPRLNALQMTPISPHMPFDRSLVFDSSEVIRIEVTEERAAMLVVDGREVALLQAGDAITCRAAPTPARFVTFDSRDFYGILKAKFGVADR